MKQPIKRLKKPLLIVVSEGIIVTRTCIIDGKTYCVNSIMKFIEALEQEKGQRCGTYFLPSWGLANDISWGLKDGKELTLINLMRMSQEVPKRNVSTEVAEHLSRMHRADLRFPILVTERLEVIDGCHRIGKNILEGLLFIEAIIIPDVLLQHFRL